MVKKDRLCAGVETARRPRCVNILASIQIIQSVALFGYGLYLVFQYGWPGIRPSASQESPLVLLFEMITSGASQIIFSIPVLIIAIALLRLASWSWMIAMAVQGLGLIITLFAYVIDQPNYPAMIMGIAIVFYLNQQDVQVALRSPRGVE